MKKFASMDARSSHVRKSPGIALIGAFVLVTGMGCQTINRQAEALFAPGGAAAEQVTPEQSAKEQFATGVELMQSAPPELEQASDAFERALDLDDQLAVAHYNLGVVKERQGDLGAAKDRYRRALSIEPRLDIAVDNLGRILEAEGQSADARRLYEESLQSYPESVGPRLRLARWAHREGDFKRAAQLAREALQFDGQSAEAYRLLSLLYAENRKNQLARLIASRGQKLAPGDAEFDFVLGRVAENENKVATAREFYERVLGKKPGHLQARRRLAALSLKNRDWKTAATQLEALLGAGESHPSLWVSLGVARKGQGKFPEAAQAYESALVADGDYGPALLNLGILQLRQLDNPEAAEARLTKYLELNAAPEKVAPLVQEARTLIAAKKEEQRMMEEMARMEAEAAAAAEAEAAAAAKAAEAAAAEESEASSAESGAAPEKPDSTPEKAADAPKAATTKRSASAEPEQKSQKSPKPRPKAPEPEAPAKPETDEAFFDD